MTPIPVKIFISGYPQTYDEMALAELISPYGQIATIKIVRDKQSGKPKGYAFIELITLQAAEEVVVALDGLQLQEKMLTINVVEEKIPARATTYPKAEKTALAEKKKRPRLSR